MKALNKRVLFVPLFAFLLFSCSKSDSNEESPTGPAYSISELQGNWDATEITFTYCGQAQIEPSSHRVVAEGGSATMNIQSNGRFTLTINFVGENESMIVKGKMFFEDGEFFAIQFDDDPPNDPTYFGDTFTGNTFSLNGGPETAEFDFDDDGNDECASVNLTLVRE